MKDLEEVSERRVWRLGGMDCGGCAARIRGAVERMEGVEAVEVSLMAERLRATLGPNADAAKLERVVRGLGYSIEAEATETPAPEAPHVWRVEGMDCGGCVAKVRGAVERLPGTEGVRVSMMAERLQARLGEGPGDADAAQVERAVRALGYAVSPLETAARDGAGEEETPGSAPEKTGWLARLNTGKGRLAAGAGALLALAWGLSLVLPPAASAWAFGAACLLGLIPVARRAVAALRQGQPFTIEMLMTLAAGGALAIGAQAEAAMVVFLFALGELLEGVAADRARGGIKALAGLMPRRARLIEADGTLREVPAERLEVGQAVLVRPGERLPADGEIEEGRSDIDESPVTGESVPVARGPGDAVHAGSVNATAALTLRVGRPPEDNTIARILRLVEEAEASRAPTERFIDRFSRVYMPVVVGLAALVAVAPPLLLGAAWGEWVYRGLALLLIGCPCALVISVPAAVASALSAGSRRGLLMKGGAVIEAAAGVTLVAFDKTGTLTEGRPRVTDAEAFEGEADALLALAAGVEQGAAHPLARAVLAEAEARGLSLPPALGAETEPGRGARAWIEGREVFVGAPAEARARGALSPRAEARVAALEAEGRTVAVVLREGRALGLIALRDEPRADAAEGVAQLHALGLRTLMLSGDNPRTAGAIAQALGMEARGGLLPADKAAALRELTGTERVMMVGDGINDAPALAAAQVGIAMGGGADAALETADGAILRDRVTDVAAQIRLSRAAMANIRQNVAMALGLKAVFLVTTAAGVTGLWPAILADTGATVLVTLNALRLLAFRPERG